MVLPIPVRLQVRRHMKTIVPSAPPQPAWGAALPARHRQVKTRTSHHEADDPSWVEDLQEKTNKHCYWAIIYRTWWVSLYRYMKHNHRYTEVWVTSRYRLACDGDLSAPWTTASSSLHKTHLMWFQRFQFRATRWRPPGTRNRPWPPQFQLRHLTIQDFTRYSPMGYHPPTTTSINAPTLLHQPPPVNNSEHSDVNHVLLY